MPLESWCSLTWWMETGVIHSPLWVQLDRTVPNPFRWFFPQPQVDSSLHVGWSIHQGISLGAALFSPVFCPVNFSSIISLDSQLCLLTVNSLLDSSWTPLPVLWPGNYLITSSEVMERLIQFFTIFQPSLSFVASCHVLQSVVSYIVSVFLLFQMGV